MPSTAISRFAYDPDAAALDVTFVSGRRYRYFEVPKPLADCFGAAPSKGRFFNALVRDRFRFAELERGKK